MKLIDRVDLATRFPQWIVCFLIGLAIDEVQLHKIRKLQRGR